MPRGFSTLIQLLIIARYSLQQDSGTVLLRQTGVNIPVGYQFPQIYKDDNPPTFPPDTSRTGQILSDLEPPQQQPTPDLLPFGGGCYTTRSGCQCDDGYRWDKDPNGPNYSGCANPSGDPNGLWCPIRPDVPCERLDKDFDYCFESEQQCPESGKPMQQCMGQSSSTNIWRCINAVRTNPGAFQEMFGSALNEGVCSPLQKLSTSAFTALGGDSSLFQMAQAESSERSTNASALFKIPSDSNELSLQERMQILSQQWDMHVKVVRADWRNFSLVSLASYLFCQDPNNHLYLSCNYNHIGVGLDQDPFTNDIFVTLILGCPKDTQCFCSR